MDLEMLLRIQQAQQIYLLNANQFLDYHAELNRYAISAQAEHVHRPHPVHEHRHRHTNVHNHHNRHIKKTLTSFKIKDILQSGANVNAENEESNITRETINRLRNPEYTHEKNIDNHKHTGQNVNIVRPWSISPRLSPAPSGETNLNNSDSLSDEEIDVEEIDGDSKQIHGKPSDFLSPLDALVEMSNNAFKGLQALESNRGSDALLNKSQIPKRKRKTRTAFSNQQIYELEKRFLYQKYLTPADRDEIANKLGLSSAQVITWFQNRRAKFKRDIDELKNDVGSVRSDVSVDK